MKVNILGTEYTIEVKEYTDDGVFERNHFDGYHDGYQKKIFTCDMHTYPGWENEEEETIKECMKQTLRHEITHAFLHESGLSDSTMQSPRGWAKNEEMIDWIAFQGPKIYEVWEEASAI